MSSSETYSQSGAVLLEQFVPETVARAMAFQLSVQVRHTGQQMLVPASIGNKPCYEAYCYHLPALLTFLWGMTPAVRQLVGRDLLPTYSYFRTYQQGDVCRIHADRPACEHSLSLTLDYADAQPWALAVGTQRLPESQRQTVRGDDDFGDDDYVEFAMQPGDAVLYRGPDYRHGRLTPNPKGWSVHLFLHWVEADGENAACAFDGQQVVGDTRFEFPEGRQ